MGSPAAAPGIRAATASEGAAGFTEVVCRRCGAAVQIAQFAVYDLLYAEAEKYPASLEHVPGTDMQWRVLGAGAVGATARTVLESPIEYAKVKGQTNQKWKLGEVYRGAGLQWARTGPMMTLYFCLFDACKRNGYASTPAGQFSERRLRVLIGPTGRVACQRKNHARRGRTAGSRARATHPARTLQRHRPRLYVRISPERRGDDRHAKGEPTHHGARA